MKVVEDKCPDTILEICFVMMETTPSSQTKTELR